jgi:hypothetical protein
MIVRVNIDRIVLARPLDAGDARALRNAVNFAVRQHVARATSEDRSLAPASIRAIGEAVGRKTVSAVS